MLHILRRRGGTKKCVFRPQILFEFRIFRCWTRVIYDRVQNGKKYFAIDVFSNFEWVTSRAGNSNENRWDKCISFAVKCNNTLNFSALDIPHSIGRKAGISKWYVLFRTLSNTYMILDWTLNNSVRTEPRNWGEEM